MSVDYMFMIMNIRYDEIDISELPGTETRVVIHSTGKKTPGGAGTHTGHADAQRHTDRTDEPHNHPNPPTTRNPHVSATTEAAADSRAAGPESTGTVPRTSRRQGRRIPQMNFIKGFDEPLRAAVRERGHRPWDEIV